MSENLIPLAISSQLDVTGEERIHAAKYNKTLSARPVYADSVGLFGDAPDVQPTAGYSYAYKTTGGTLPRVCSLASGVLPTGLTLNSNCTITGSAPPSPETQSFVVRLTDTASPTHTTTLADTITVAPLVWTHALTGVGQTIYDAEIYNGIMMVGGNNSSLVRSTDFGATWAIIPLSTQISDNVAIENLWVQGGVWYISGNIYNGGNPIKGYYSSTDGLLWAQAATAAALGSVPGANTSVIDGVGWGSLYSAANTKISQPLAPSNVIDLGGAYGDMWTIAKLGGVYLIATNDGSTIRILKGASLATCSVVFTLAVGANPSQFAYGNNLWMLATSAGLYKSTDATTWVNLGANTSAVIFFNGLFYKSDAANIYASPDGVTWVIVDSYLVNETRSILRTTGNRILCTGFNQKTMTTVGL